MIETIVINIVSLVSSVTVLIHSNMMRLTEIHCWGDYRYDYRPVYGRQLLFAHGERNVFCFVHPVLFIK